MRRTYSLLLLLLALGAFAPRGSLAGEDEQPGRGPRGGPPAGGRRGPPAGRGKDTMQDRIGGLPEAVLEQQSRKVFDVPSVDEACALALAAASKVAKPLIDTTYHTGKRLRVPQDHPTIQAAIDAASRRDVVVVKAGTYYELIRMKDGVKLISAGASSTEKPVAVKGARLTLPQRALVTILDGSRAKASRHGMIDFDPGTGEHTIVDGFTLQNLPQQNHHTPGHAHGINVRGASPVVMNCLIQANGSTGIGNHVVYQDQGSAIGKRDFRYANIEHAASPVIYHNIIRDNVGLGIGCNHFSTPRILGNEVCGNDDSALAAEHGEETGPAIGAKHGAAPLVVGNLVHNNAGGGILCKAGAEQGRKAIDRITHTTARFNVVWKNGAQRPGISANGAGSRKTPVVFERNWVFDSPLVGMALSHGAVGVLAGNTVIRSKLPGISINGATVLRLNGNKVAGGAGPGFVILADSHVLEMTGNAAQDNQGPRFMLRGGRVDGPKKQAK